MLVRPRPASLLAVLGRDRVRRSPPAAARDSGADTGGDATPTKRREAVGDQADRHQRAAARQGQGGRHAPLGGRPVLDPVELQPAQRPELDDGQVLYGADAAAVHRRRDGERQPQPGLPDAAEADQRAAQAGRHARAQPEGELVRRHADHGEGLRDAVEGAQRHATRKYQIASSTGYDQIESVTQGRTSSRSSSPSAKPFADWKALFARCIRPSTRTRPSTSTRAT